MQNFLRQPRNASRLSQSLLSSTTCSYSYRRSIPQLYRPSTICQSTRHHATEQSEKSKKGRKASKAKKPEEDATDQDASPVAKRTTQPGKAPPGFENFYQSKTLSTPPASQQKHDGPRTQDSTEQSEASKDADVVPGFKKLTEEQERILLSALEKVSGMMPKSLEKETAKAFEDVKKYGVPEELVKTMEELRNGKPLSLPMTAKIIKYGAQMNKMHVEWRMDPEAFLKAQKKSPGTTEGESRNQNEKQERKQGSGSGNPNFAEFKMDTSTFLVSAFTAYLLYRMVMPSDNLREITWQEFQTSFLNKGLVDKLTVINGNRVKVHVHRETLSQMHPDSPATHNNFYYFFTIGSIEAFERKLDAAQSELGIPSSERIPVSYTHEVSWGSTLASFGPTLLLTGLMIWGLRRAAGGSSGGGSGGIFGMGRSRAKKFNHEADVKIRFKDVAGMDEAKVEIMEFVGFLKDPGRFQRLGAKIPRGAILSGPPGTGKTLLAKATAGESGVPFFSVSGSEFVEMFVGVGPSRVRDLFANARKSTPCIIFIDEIDAIGKSRAKQSFGGGNDERESTLNQILTEMDGFNTSEQVVVLAGTNRPDVLDSALMRPGRFDRHIAIDRPTMEGRKQIFGVHLRNIVTSEDKEALQGRLAALTPGFSGADIANCCNEAALIAARQSADKVVASHFEQAIERTVAGLEKKTLVLSPEEKKTVAYHEAGHAICGWFLRWADPLLKVSIIPRGQGALGYALNVPADNYLLNINQLMDRMAMTLGGRVSEELHFESVTSGASDDFNKVTRWATMMVTKFGMSEKIGFIFYEDDNQSLHKPFSEETARQIDLEVRRIVDAAYKQCKDLLTEKKKEVGIVAEELLKKEMLDRDDMVRLLGKRPFPDNKEFEKYFGGGGKSAPPPPPGEVSGSGVPPVGGPAAPAIFKKIEY